MGIMNGPIFVSADQAFYYELKTSFDYAVQRMEKAQDNALAVITEVAKNTEKAIATEAKKTAIITALQIRREIDEVNQTGAVITSSAKFLFILAEENARATEKAVEATVTIAKQIVVVIVPYIPDAELVCFTAAGGPVGAISSATRQYGIKVGYDLSKYTPPVICDLDEVKAMAQISAEVYNQNSFGASRAGFTRLSLEQIEKDLGMAIGDVKKYFDNNKTNPVSGLACGLYKNDFNQYVLAFRGTEPLTKEDWVTNIEQGVGMPAEAYKMAKDLAGIIKDLFSKHNGKLTLSGHSLGGGMAAAAACYHNLRGITFNAAGVNANTVEHRKTDSGITNYTVIGEILTTMQEIYGAVPDALGQQKKLMYAKVQDPVSLHLMEAVMAALDAYNA